MFVIDSLQNRDRSLRLLAGGVLAGLLMLLGGLWYVQVISSERYQEGLLDQAYRTVRLPAVRGRILDRNGIPLAENRPSYNLDLYLADLSRHFAETYRHIRPAGWLSRVEREALERQARLLVVSNIVQQVSGSLQQPRGLNEKLFHRHYEEQRALPLTILENLQPAQVARFAEQPPKVPGVELEVQPTRHYPFASTAAHLLGALRRDDSSVEDEESFYHYRLPDFKGLVGIEAIFDEHLRGKAGAKAMMVNRLGYRSTETIQTAPEPGEHVTLTIDLPLQQVAERALVNANGPDTRGAAVVLDARNGDVLAMASVPTFDPNLFLGRIPPEEMERLNDAKQRPQINRATQENYLPGSIFKVVVALAALDLGVLDPAEVIHNPGYYQLAKRRVDDTAAPGNYDFRRAFDRSSNTYFITQGLKPGVLQRVIDIGQKLHLGERLEILPRQETKGHFPSMTDVARGWSDGDTANLSIGQGPISVTPVHMALMTAAVVNGGKVFWPRLVARIDPADPTSGEAVKEFPAGRVRDQLDVKTNTFQIVRKAMLDEVADRDGTGKEAAVPGLLIGGKTGTAQIELGGRVVDHTTWFVSAAPMDNPRFIVVVMVESGQSGAKTCAPVAAKIYREIQRRFLTPAKPNAMAGAKRNV
jgi:penicillin-binding protein 2